MRYSVKIPAKGYVHFWIEASSEDEAIEKGIDALEQQDEIYTEINIDSSSESVSFTALTCMLNDGIDDEPFAWENDWN